jgi:hypothetical protein
MTWIWGIDGLGTESQTLWIDSPDGTREYTATDTHWSWSGDRPEIVTETVAEHDIQAAFADDIERQ